MGKKTKVGKQRKDKYYTLAKETGYRSRAAFKLIQLNRKFGFLERSRVLVDLCAAPGGWLQVAQKFMPLSKVIVGIDLVPIKSIPNVMTFQCDITTPECRKLLKTELKTWSVDIFLNDGAPNVGRNWLHDAYNQVRLVLSAVQLATEFLRKGGWFVTKVFRSKDYDALIWLLKKLFKDVHVTKPQASRSESAEIFVVCEKYLAPDKIDPKFFDPNYLFEDVSSLAVAKKMKSEFLKPSKKQKRPRSDGYEDGKLICHESLPVSEFIKSDQHIELLSKANEVQFDDKSIEEHELTTKEIKELCKDIKVLGHKDLLSLIRWRKKLKEALKKEKGVEESEETEEPLEIETVDSGDEEMEDLTREMKKKRKNMLKERRKTALRMNLNMIHKDDQIVDTDMELFHIEHLKSKGDYQKFEELHLSSEEEGEKEEEEVAEDVKSRKKKKKVVFYDQDDPKEDPVDDSDNGSRTTEECYSSESDLSESEAADANEDGEEDSGLVVDFKDKLAEKEKGKLFFERGLLKEMDDDDVDLEVMMEDEPKKRGKKREAKSDSESEDELTTKDENKKKKIKPPLDAEGLALAASMVSSKKAKEDLVDDAWNRYAIGDDDNLPPWFKEHEEKYFRKLIPVNPELVEQYEKKFKDINVRSIKKVVEAKARKKKRAMRKMEKLKKRATVITDTEDMSEKEKAVHLRSLYKKALKPNKDKKPTVVVAKKGAARRRPAGVKGRYKMVDSRMKKDKRLKTTEKDKKQKKRPKMRKAPAANKKDKRRRNGPQKKPQKKRNRK